jgi:hypothetical protein
MRVLVIGNEVKIEEFHVSDHCYEEFGRILDQSHIVVYG